MDANSVYNIRERLSLTPEHNTLPSSQYQDWFDIIIKDDIENALELFGTIPEAQKISLMHNSFKFNNNVIEFGKTAEIHSKVNLPFHTAIACGSKKVAELMINEGVKITGVNSDKNNSLHTAIIFAFNIPKSEKKVCKTLCWLFEKLMEHTLHDLLFKENKECLRPLEMAAQQGCLQIMKLLFETKGHVIEESVAGFGIYRFHDVTEYEVGERHCVSPVNMLAFLDEKKLLDDVTNEVILSPCILGWINCEIKSNHPLLVSWFLIRIFSLPCILY
jgi:hypothetical protein